MISEKTPGLYKGFCAIRITNLSQTNRKILQYRPACRSHYSNVIFGKFQGI